MTSSFADLKRSRETALESLSKEVEKASGGFTKQDDDRFWQPEVDKAGNGYAVIRFLPAPQGEDVPWVRLWDHGFQGPGGWYIEKSLSTIGQDDPVLEFNSALWATSKDDNSPARKQVRNQKRRLYYISNILVIRDTANPKNEGQVKLYRYGKKIFQKLNRKMTPEFEDETPMNPFDFWSGADFKLKICKVEGYRNYDNSEFAASAPIANNDADIEKIWKNEYSLQAFLAQSEFRSYDELKKRFNKVLGLTDDPIKQEEKRIDRSLGKIDTVEPDVGETDDDPGLDYFNKLAEDDE